MKIAIIIERFDIALGGAERSVSELAEELANLGLDVDIIAAKGGGNNGKIHILCQDYPNKRVPLKVFTEQIKKHIQMVKYDIIHSVLPIECADIYQPRGGSFAEAIKQNAASYENPIMVKFKYWTSRLNLRRQEMLSGEKNICSDSSTVIIAALSEYVRRQFVVHYNLPAKRIEVIANGVKCGAVSRFETDKTLLPKSWLNGNNAVFLFAANNFRLKGLNCLLRAFVLLQNKKLARTPRLIVAGNDKSAKKYVEIVKRLNLTESVYFAGSLANVKQWISISNAAILPTFYDPASRFILEAISLAVPVITTKLNGSSEMFLNNDDSLIIDSPTDIIALSEAIACICNPNKESICRQTIIKNKLPDKVSITNHCLKLIDLYNDILEHRKSNFQY